MPPSAILFRCVCVCLCFLVCSYRTRFYGLCGGESRMHIERTRRECKRRRVGPPNTRAHMNALDVCASVCVFVCVGAAVNDGKWCDGSTADGDLRSDTFAHTNTRRIREHKHAYVSRERRRTSLASPRCTTSQRKRLRMRTCCAAAAAAAPVLTWCDSCTYFDMLCDHCRGVCPFYLDVSTWSGFRMFRFRLFRFGSFHELMTDSKAAMDYNSGSDDIFDAECSVFVSRDDNFWCQM